MTALPIDDSRPRPRRRLRLSVLLLCMAAGPLIVEATMRYLLFHDGAFANEHGRVFRQAGLYADPQLDDAYWRLMHRLKRSEGRGVDGPPFDPILGWVNGKIASGTYAHRMDARLADRPTLLMYGASFAQGLDDGSIDGAPFSDRLNFVNYGVGGYGVDQAYLLMRQTLDRYVESSPFVAMGLVADSDFDRCSLHFRSLPKPHFTLHDGSLDLDGAVFEGGPDAYVEEYGTGITSYAWNYLLRTKRVLPLSLRIKWSGLDRKKAEQDELIEAIVLAIQSDVEQRKLKYGFVLFSSLQTLPPRPVSGRELKLRALFKQHAIPYVSMRDVMIAAAEEQGVGLEEFFHSDGRFRNHPNERGNRVILKALRERVEPIVDRQSAPR